MYSSNKFPNRQGGIHVNPVGIYKYIMQPFGIVSTIYAEDGHVRFSSLKPYPYLTSTRQGNTNKHLVTQTAMSSLKKAQFK